MLRFLLWILIGWWFWRLVRPHRRVPPSSGRQRFRDNQPPAIPPLEQLTQQEITDADYEEIPPHETG